MKKIKESHQFASYLCNKIWDILICWKFNLAFNIGLPKKVILHKALIVDFSLHIFVHTKMIVMEEYVISHKEQLLMNIQIL